MLLYTNNKTSAALRQMSESELHEHLDSAIKLARQKAKTTKQRKLALRQQRYDLLQEKKRKKAEKQMKKLKEKQKAQDDISVDGQCKSYASIKELLSKYTSDKGKIAAIKRQFAFYKTLAIPNIPASKFYLTSQSKPIPLEALTENLIFIVERWIIAMQQPVEQTQSDQISKQRIVSKVGSVSLLKRKFQHDANDERERMGKKKRKSCFPGDEIVGQRIKHKFEVTTRAGKTRNEWYKGTVIRKACEDEIEMASPEDKIYIERGLTLYVVDYDKETDLESHALEADWNNGDMLIIPE